MNKSSNPMFSDIMFEETAEEGGRSCSYVGIFGKTFILVVVSILCALVGIPFLAQQGLLYGFLIGSVFLGFIFAIVGRLSLTASPVCSILYAVCEGVFLGTLTAVLEAFFPGIGFAAVASTLSVVLVMAFLYMTGIVKASQKFKSFLITALLSILIVNLVIMITALCGNKVLWDLFYGNSVFSLVIAVLVVIIAALCLVIDFDYATRLVESESPKKYEWPAALGLMVSIVYLYVRILRLLVIVMSRRK